MRNLTDLAEEYRDSWNLPGHGAVVFYDDEARGWTAELNRPESWCPGCIAITSGGSAYRAEGGNDYDGAKTWQPVATL